MKDKPIIYRPPTVQDGTAIWQLVRDSGTLDPNSVYCYLLLCKDFAGTSAVAERDGELLGFVTAYRPPASAQTLFVWQVGVSAAARGQGVAGALLRAVLDRDLCRDVHYVEATVGPSNTASRALFASLAKRLDTALSEQVCFDSALFPHGEHEAENLLRIGPF